MLPDRLRTVLVAVDFSEAAGEAVALGGLLASAGSAALVALHAEPRDLPPYFTVQQIASFERAHQEAHREAEAFLRAFVAARTAWDADVRIREERPAEAILQAAVDADLVLMGTHGRRGPSRWWMGSVAERVVRGCDRPVLVVPERGVAAAPLEVFSHVLLIGSEGQATGPALSWVARLIEPLGGTVIDGGEARTCDVAAFRSASMVAAVLPPAVETPRVPDLGVLLRECQRPALFVRT